MKSISSWLQPLTVVTLAAIATYDFFPAQVQAADSETIPIVTRSTETVARQDIEANPEGAQEQPWETSDKEEELAEGEMEIPELLGAIPPANFDPIPIYVPPAESRANRTCPNFLDLFIDAIVERPTFSSAKWGILVESLNGETFYSRNANSRLIPASNTKLLTTAAALQRLSPNTTIRSTSLREWIRVTNTNSNNNYAEVLLSTIGGASAARQSLLQLGLNGNGFRQADGSGLSRSNSISPDTIVDLLRVMKTAKGNDVFVDSLAVAGRTGTLRRRLSGVSVQGKTGTLRGVKALSGYLEHPEYGTIIFSILVNQPGQSWNTMSNAIDEVVLELTKLTRCF